MALFLSKRLSQQNETVFCHINVEVCVAIWLWRLGPPGSLVSRPFTSQRKNIPPWCLNHKWSITVSILPKHPYLQWVLVRLFSDQAYTHIITKHCHCGLERGFLITWGWCSLPNFATLWTSPLTSQDSQTAT